MPPDSRMIRPLSVSLGIATCTLLCAAILFSLWQSSVPDPQLPPIRTSPYLNTGPNASYVGGKSCAECHQAEFESYQRTAHSRALSDIIAAEEPPDGTFTHATSGRSYESVHADGRLIHREFAGLDTSGTLLAEFPLRYRIGSGSFSRSYLIEVDGFLMESPLTWYTSRPGWALSPGYDGANVGFSRPTEIRCIRCHAGRVESINGSPHRLKIHEQAIGCESCHGPGSLHATHWKNGTPTGDMDLTIVNPRRLSRELLDSICAQCHLHSAATVELRGRSLADFRPGLPLEDFQVHYGLETPRKTMEVVGHMEQLHLSRCYIETESLSCVTCHPPHAKPDAKEAIEFYRNRCLQCHTTDTCGKPRAERHMLSPDDNCVTCHMPNVPTEIPHFAFTHHRIGIHTVESLERQAPAVGTLKLLVEDPGLSPADQSRSLGLGYMQIGDHPEHSRNQVVYHRRAMKFLQQFRDQGLHDPDVEAAISRLTWMRDRDACIAAAEAVLKADNATPDARATALFTLGSTRFQRGEFEQAIQVLDQLTPIRRQEDVWRILSQCHEQLGDSAAALDAAREAVEINPARPDLQSRLADLLSQAGDHVSAAKHAAIARAMSRP